MSKIISLPLRAFKQLLQDELRKTCRDNGWEFDNVSKRGYALQHWVAELFCRADLGIETDPQSAVLTSKDLGADVVLEDTTRQHLRIIQCKASSLGKESKLPPLDEGEVNDFFSRHDQFMNRAWVRNHGSEQAFVLLGDYRDRVKNGWTVEFIFVTTMNSNDRVAELVNTRNTTYAKSFISVTCRLLDLDALKEFYNQANSVEESIADEIHIDLPMGHYFEKRTPYKTLIAVIKGNTLRNLYRTYKESLFTYNIRDFLGKARAINRAMIATAEENPEGFFYFNNGVSAVCTQFDIKADRLTAKRLQIINGAQTVGALYAAEENPDVQILFRLTESDKAKLNENIIRFNNTQNAINSSDFRSNDPIQVWLENEFAKLKPHGALPLLHYSRKRSYKRHKGATILTIEEMAKVQFAFLHEPTIIYESPKQLWTYQSEGGSYEQAFGEHDEITSFWSPRRWYMGLIALAIYLRILSESSNEMQETSELWYLKRLRFHLLSLAGAFIRHKHQENPEVLLETGAFDALWATYWPAARQAMIFQFENAVTEKSTLSAFARNPKRWDEMLRSFARIMKFTLPTEGERNGV